MAGLDTATAAKINDTASASRAALNATYAPKGLETSKLDKTEAASTYANKAAVARIAPGGTRGVAFCGDSNSAAGVTGAGGVGVYNLLTAPTIPTEDNSWIGWAIQSGAGRFHAAVHAATPSITPDVWNTQFLTNVVAQAPYAAVDALGTNNVENLTQQITALTAMYDALDAAGIKVIVCSIPPKTGFVADVQRLNRWKRATAKRRGYLFVDNYSTLVDPATGTMLAAYDSDGTHFNAAGGRAVGLNFGATIAAAWPYTAELAAAQPAPADLVVKPLLLNKTGGGGFAPEDWENLGGLGSVTTAVETVAGVAGKMFTITQGGTPADANTALTLPANLIVGHRYVLAYRYQLDVPGTAPTGATVRLEVATGGGTSLCSRTIKQALALTTVVNEFTCPAGLSAYNYRLRVQLNGGGTGTKLWIGQVTMFDLTAAGL